MTNTSKRTRQPQGIPTGGEFAREAKAENPDLVHPTLSPTLVDIATWTGAEVTDDAIELTIDPSGDGVWTIRATDGEGSLPTDQRAVITVTSPLGEEVSYLTDIIDDPTPEQVAQKITNDVNYLAHEGRRDRNARIESAVNAAVADGQFMSWHQGTFSTPTLSMGRNAAGQQIRVAAILTKDNGSGMTDRLNVISAQTGSWNLSLRGEVVGSHDTFDSLHRAAGEVGPDNPELAELVAISAKYHGVSNNCPGTVRQMVQADQIEAEEGGRTDTWRMRCEEEIPNDRKHRFGGFLVKELDVADVRRVIDLMMRPAMRATPYT